MRERRRSMRAGMVRCDGCGLRFKIVPEMERTEEGGERHLFCCSHCGREYVVAEVSFRGLQLREQVARLRKQQWKLPPGDPRRAEYGERMAALLEALEMEVRP